MTRDERAALEARRLRTAAADTAAWALFAGDDDTAGAMLEQAHAARVQADELEGMLPLGV